MRGEEPPAELLVEERGLHSSIEEDVRKFLQSKTHKELEEIHSGVEAQLRSGKVVEFWEVIFKRIHIYKAKVCTPAHFIFQQQVSGLISNFCKSRPF